MDFKKASEFNRANGSRTVSAQYDQGLRSYMLSIYNYMAAALVLTGITAFAVSSSPALMQTIFGSPLKWVVMLAPLGFVIFLSARIHKLSVPAAQTSFWAFGAIMGISLASFFAVYTGESIARAFFVTAGTFAAMSLYGYTTKKDLSGMGSFLIMGVFGLIIASIVNIFLQSSALQFGLSVVTVLVFVGLTAYDTQRLKHTYDMVAGHPESMSKAVIMGALSLYMNFINIFVALLQLFGNRNQ